MPWMEDLATAAPADSPGPLALQHHCLLTSQPSRVPRTAHLREMLKTEVLRETALPEESRVGKFENGVRWDTPVLPSLGRLRQEVCHKCEASLCYVATLSHNYGQSREP